MDENKSVLAATENPFDESVVFEPKRELIKEIAPHLPARMRFADGQGELGPDAAVIVWGSMLESESGKEVCP